MGWDSETSQAQLSAQSAGVTSSDAVGGVRLQPATIATITPIGRAALLLLAPLPLPPVSPRG